MKQFTAISLSGPDIDSGRLDKLKKKINSLVSEGNRIPAFGLGENDRVDLFPLGEGILVVVASNEATDEFADSIQANLSQKYPEIKFAAISIKENESIHAYKVNLGE